MDTNSGLHLSLEAFVGFIQVDCTLDLIFCVFISMIFFMGKRWHVKFYVNAYFLRNKHCNFAGAKGRNISDGSVSSIVGFSDLDL